MQVTPILEAQRRCINWRLSVKGIACKSVKGRREVGEKNSNGENSFFVCYCMSSTCVITQRAAEGSLYRAKFRNPYYSVSNLTLFYTRVREQCNDLEK
jgi:hypothetical protein